MATYNIAGVIQSIDHQLYCYDTTYKTYQEALQNTEDILHLIVVMEVKDNDSSAYKFVDMNTLLSKYLTEPEYVEYHATNWDELLEFLKELYNCTDLKHKKGVILNQYCVHSPVPRYQYYKYDGVERTRITPFVTNLKDTINVVSFGYTNKMDATYVNKDFPEIRGLSHRRVAMPDLVFKKTDSDLDLDLKNTIPSIDGVICYPLYSEDTKELYACNGARMLANTTDSNSLNILMLDFSKLGTLHHCKLSQCKQELYIKAGDKVWIYDDSKHVASNLLDPVVKYWQDCQFSMKFKLPIGMPFGIPLLSLAGRLFMPGVDDLFAYAEGGYTVLEFHTSADILENIVASNLQHQNLFYKKSEIFRTVLSYVFGNIFVDQAYEHDGGSDDWKSIQFHMDQIIPFVTMIVPEEKKEYGIDIIKPMTVMRFGKLIFPSKAKGLLMNKDTREFIDYTRVPYKDQTLVTFSHQHPLFIEKREGANTNSDPVHIGPMSYAEAALYTPSDTEVYYNLVDHKYRLTTKSENTTIAISNERPYEAIPNSNPTVFDWDLITEGLTEEEATPHYNAAGKSWYLMKSGIVYAESEPYSFPLYTDFTTWHRIEYNREQEVLDIDYDTAIAYLQMQSNKSHSATNVGLYNTSAKRFEMIDNTNTVLMHSEECDEEDDYTELTWTSDVDEYEDEYDEVLLHIKATYMNPRFIKLYDAATDTFEMQDYATGIAHIRAVNCLAGAHEELRWYKLFPYYCEYNEWYRVVDGETIVTDGVRCDRMAWQLNPTTFKSGYEQYLAGEFIKDPRKYVLLDFNIYKHEDGANDLLDPESNPEFMSDDVETPAIPVLTAEHEPVKDKIKVGIGTAPRVVTQLKITPTITEGSISTTTITAKNAANNGEVYADYDGKYVQSDPNAVGTSRVWVNNLTSSISICYRADAEHPENSHWAILNGSIEIFATDMAMEGSAPYNTELIWRLV